MYVAAGIDCYSRRVAGWAIADHMRTELVADTLKAADALRGTLSGFIRITEGQYTAGAFA